MPTKLIRRNGVLVREEVAPESAPTSPAGAQALGATPDQSKMYGSGQQKEAVINQAVEAPKTLAGAQRYQGPRTQATLGEEAASSKAARLSQLGGLGARVQSQVRSQIEQPIAAAGVQINADMTAGWSDEEKGLLDQVINAATPEEREAAVAGLANLKGGTANVTQLLSDMGVSLGEQGQQAMGLSQVNLTPEIMDEFGGADQIAADIGVSPEELSQMTVEDFEAKLRELESNEFSKVEALRAELRSASPIRRQEILQELQALGATGITGAEQSVDNLQQKVEDADLVTFGGVEYELGDLLENDAISSAITLAVRDPQELEKLRETEPALAEWIETNKTDLENVVKDIEATTAAAEETATTIREFTQHLTPELKKVFGIDLEYMTADEFEALKQGLETGYTPDGEVFAAAGAWNAAKQSPEIAQAIQNSPQMIDKFVTIDAGTGQTVPMSAGEITEAFELGKTMSEENPHYDVLSELIPGVKGDFITDPSTAAKIKKYSNLLTMLPDDITQDDALRGDLIEGLKSGSLDEETIKAIIKDPTTAREKFEAIGKYADLKEEFDRIDSKDLSKLLAFATGEPGLSAFEVNRKYTNAAMMAKFDPNSRKIYEALKELDTNDDGVINEDDTLALHERVSGFLNKEGGGRIKGFDMLSNVKTNLSSGLATPMSREYQELADGYNQIMADKKITKEDLRVLTPDQMNKLTARGLLNVADVRAALRDNYYSNVVNNPKVFDAITRDVGQQVKALNPNVAGFDKYGNVTLKRNYPKNLAQVGELEASVKEIKNMLATTSEYDPKYHYLRSVFENADRLAKNHRRILEHNKKKKAKVTTDATRIKGINS